MVNTILSLLFVGVSAIIINTDDPQVHYKGEFLAVLWVSVTGLGCSWIHTGMKRIVTENREVTSDVMRSYLQGYCNLVTLFPFSFLAQPFLYRSPVFLAFYTRVCVERKKEEYTAARSIVEDCWINLHCLEAQAPSVVQVYAVLTHMKRAHLCARQASLPGDATDLLDTVAEIIGQMRGYVIAYLRDSTVQQTESLRRPAVQRYELLSEMCEQFKLATPRKDVSTVLDDARNVLLRIHSLEWHGDTVCFVA